MAIHKARAKRKATGGRYHANHKKKAREIGRNPLFTKLGETKKKVLRARGGNKINALTYANTATINVAGKAEKVKIKRIVENAASRHFVRQNIISKGAIIETDKGLARVTSRPTRDGVVNAVLMKK